MAGRGHGCEVCSRRGARQHATTMNDITVPTDSTRPPTEDALSVRQMLAIIRSRWLLVLLCTVIATSLGVAAGLLMEPVYRSTALLMPNQSNDRSGLLGSMLG